MAIETDFAKEFEVLRKRCLELEEKSKRDDIRCSMLENEVENLKKKNQELEGKIIMTPKVIVDPTYVENDGDDLLHLMFENEALGIEKQKALDKVKELESVIKSMNEKAEHDRNVVSGGTKEAFRTCSRKLLPFEEDGCPDMEMSLSTPGVAQPFFRDIIDINDEDVNYKESDLAKSQSSFKNNVHKTNPEHTGEEPMDELKFHSSDSRTAKRKRAADTIIIDVEDMYDDKAPVCKLNAQHGSRVMTDSEDEVKENVSRRRPRRSRRLKSQKKEDNIDDEDSYDDNAPSCTLNAQYGSRVMTDSEDEFKENVSRRRHTRLRRLQSQNKEDKSSIDLTRSYSSSEDEEDNDGVDGSGSEGESLGDFIVSSESDSESGDSIGEPEDALGEYKTTLEKIGRKKTSNYKWDSEADMLSAFGKDPELCMRAVCALYRKQTADEQTSKVTIHYNGQGFSQPDASRGSKLAEFLLDGDPNGDLNKTVEELEAYDSKGVNQCRSLAVRYSKQLFRIYQNKEDPYFLPEWLILG